MSLRVDITPLRSSRDFRLLVSASTVFYLGASIAYVAVPYQIYTLTGSNTMVGLIGLVELIPLLISGLWGGALADHVDRQRLLVATGIAQVLFTSVLAVNAALATPQIWLLFVIAPFLVSASALQRPSREALLPRTVTHDQLPAANALGSMGWQFGNLVGPTIGGLLLSSVGASWCFIVDVFGIAIATSLYARMRRYPHREQTTPPSFAGILEGVRYAVSRRDLLGTYAVDIAVMFLAMPIVLFPALAATIFREPHLLGLLYTSETVGAVIASTLSGFLRQGSGHRCLRLWTLHCAGRPGAVVLAVRSGAGCRWRVRYDLRGLPHDLVESVNPRGFAGAARRDRNAELFGRPLGRSGAGGVHRR